MSPPPQHQDCTVARGEDQGIGISLPPGLLRKVLVASGAADTGKGRVRLSWRVYGFL